MVFLQFLLCRVGRDLRFSWGARAPKLQASDRDFLRLHGRRCHAQVDAQFLHEYTRVQPLLQ